MRLGAWIVATVLTLGALGSQADAQRRGKTFRIVVWDERQPAQKQVYENFLGNHLADFLRKQASAKNPNALEFTVKSVGLDDPEQGLSKETLDECDVLIWWGHQRHDDLKPERAHDIVRRVKEGKLSLFALHSAHWSRPFMEVMNERAIQDALKTLPPKERDSAVIVAPIVPRHQPGLNDPMTPSFVKSVGADGAVTLNITLPLCVFPFVRGDGKPSHVRVLLPKHPIAKGVPETFDIPHTEMYGDPFHVPTPDAVVFEEKWDAGESFRSGSVWQVGKGKVVYFRPGHETFDVYKQPTVLQIIENTVRWLGSKAKR